MGSKNTKTHLATLDDSAEFPGCPKLSKKALDSSAIMTPAAKHARQVDVGEQLKNNLALYLRTLQRFINIADGKRPSMGQAAPSRYSLHTQYSNLY